MSETMEVDPLSCSPMKNITNLPQKTPEYAGKMKSKRDFRSRYKTSPRWVENYRDKCLTELNNRRRLRQADLIDKFRSIKVSNDAEYLKDKMIQEVMRDVWKQMDGPDITDEILDWHDSFMQQLQQEIEDQYEYLEKLEQNHVEEMLDQLNSVVCVVCQRDNWNFYWADASTHIKCNGCRFHMTIEYYIDEELMSDYIHKLIFRHSQNCDKSTNFHPVEDSETKLGFCKNIRAYCQFCGFEETFIS